MEDTFRVTVGAVADTLSVTNATTFLNTQTTSGLVVTRNAADGNEVGFFKVTNITNGTLFLSDGTTQVTDNSFVAFGGLGTTSLKFTPNNGLNNGSFQVQASVSASNAGLGGSTVTATITVNELPSLIVTTASDVVNAKDNQTSLREAISYANSHANVGGTPDTIGFNILPAGAKTITLSNALGALPDISDPVVIDGATQPGTAELPRLTVSGVNIVATVNGLTFNTTGSRLHGLKLHNFKGHGVAISGDNNVVGVTLDDSSAKNFLFNNGGDGISVLSGTGNVLRANGFQSNGGQEIDLGDDGVTNNDAVPDADPGANNLQNFPVITRVAVGVKTTTVIGTLNSAPNRTYRLNFYRSADTTQASFLPVSSSTDVTTNGSGMGSFSVSIGTNVAQRFWRATATDVLSGDSSELDAAVPAVVDTMPPTVTVDAKTLTSGQPFGTVSGTVTDNNAGAAVSFTLRRMVDNTWWDGATPGHWLPTATLLPSTVTGNATATATWASDDTLPDGSLPGAGDMLEGDYVIYATATDDAGNQRLGQRTASYPGALPSVTIDTPSGTGDPLEVSALPTVGGTASDGANGSTESGLKQVLLNIIRSDNKYWTGSDWGAFTSLATTPTPDPLNGAHSATWERTASGQGLPPVTSNPTTTPGLEVGKSYVLRATAMDRSGKQSSATRRIKIVMAASVAHVPAPAAPSKSSAPPPAAPPPAAPTPAAPTPAAQPVSASANVLANVSASSILLEFEGAAPSGDFAVTVNGDAVKVNDIQREGNTVTLLLPDDSLREGDAVVVTWKGGQAIATAE